MKMKMKIFTRSLVVGAGLAPLATALSSYTPLTSGGPTYRVGIPAGSSISSTAPGTVYFSLSAPSTYQWVGLGIGEQMTNALIFVMYADGNGNVTISARDGEGGHVEPVFDSTLQSGVELLEGSGVAGGVMTANVKCTSCTLLSSATSTSSPWICAWLSGTALDSTDEQVTIKQHGSNSMRQFTFDLTAASLASDSNPFVSSSSASAGGTSSATGTSPASSSSPDSDSDGNTGSSTTSSSFTKIPDYRKAHGIIMGVTVVLLFPLGSIFMRVVGNPWMHGLLQIFSLAALLSGFGVGIKLAQMTDYLYESTGKTHTIFGTVIIGLFLIQPFLGLYHHYLYKKTGSRTPVSHGHIWYGRMLMLLAIVNGGLGLKLSDRTKGRKIAYSVVAGVMGVLYILIVVVKRKGRGKGNGVSGVSGGEERNLGVARKRDMTETVSS